jgi:hypothetical protein
LYYYQHNGMTVFKILPFIKNSTNSIIAYPCYGQGEEDFLPSILVPVCTTKYLVLCYLQRALKVTFLNRKYRRQARTERACVNSISTVLAE